MSRRSFLLASVATAAAQPLGVVSDVPVPLVGVRSAAALHAATSVNQHFDYTDTAYDDGRHHPDDPSASQQIVDLGVRCVRTAIPSDELMGRKASVVRGHLERVLEAGCDVHVIIPASGDPRAALAFARSFFGHHVRLFEGLNEPYRFSSSRAAYAAQRRWWEVLRADPFWDDVPLIAPSDDPASYFDPESRPRARATQQGANLHPYAGGRTPESTLGPHVRAWQQVLGRDTPLYVTEFGWHTAINNRNSGHFGVSGDPDQRWYLDATGRPQPYASRADGLSVQAAYLIRGLLEDFRLGVRLSSIYELQNQKPVDNTDPTVRGPARAGYTEMEQHFGLVAVDDVDGTWRTRGLPSYDAVRRFQARLADHGRGAAPTAWPVQMHAPQGVRSLALGRRDGSLDLALWSVEPLQAEAVHSPRAGDVRDVDYVVADPAARSGLADSRHPVGHRFPAGSIASDGDQDVEFGKYFGAVVGPHLYPEPVPVMVRLGPWCHATAMHPCRSDVVRDLGRGQGFVVPAPADPVLLRFTVQ